MARRGRARFCALSQLVERSHPGLDAYAAIERGLICVGGRVVTNPRSLVRDDAVITVGVAHSRLRGEAKLEAALDRFALEARGRVALDLGASAGGFTRVLLRAGAVRVYAVDAGFGQLLGSLRQNPAVVNLERTNVADLSTAVVPDVVDVVTADLSYVSLASALRQLDEGVVVASDADLVALIKPMYELRLAEPPHGAASLLAACRRAADGAAAAGWIVKKLTRSPVRGRRGAIEFLMHATRRG